MLSLLGDLSQAEKSAESEESFEHKTIPCLRRDSLRHLREIWLSGWLTLHLRIAIISPMLSETDIKKFEAQLLKDEARLEEEIVRLEAPTDFGDETDHGEEESDEDEELENKSGAATALKNRLADLQTALAKIPAKKYGICDNCGKAIDKEVLKVAPESRLCQSCKKKV